MPLGDVVEGVQLQGTPPSLPEAGKLVSGASPHTPDAADGERGEAAGLTSAAGHLWVIRSTHRPFSLICGTSELEQKPRDDQIGPSASRRVCTLRRSSWPEVTCACPSVLAAPSATFVCSITVVCQFSLASNCSHSCFTFNLS